MGTSGTGRAAYTHLVDAWQRYRVLLAIVLALLVIAAVVVTLVVTAMETARRDGSGDAAAAVLLRSESVATFPESGFRLSGPV
jgi:hypothetical protein